MSNVTTSNYPLPYTGSSSITTTAKTTYTSSSMPGAWLYSTTGSIPIYNSISDLSANQYAFNRSLNDSSNWAVSTAAASSPNWYSVAMSSNGKYAVACDNNGTGLLWYSSNFGKTWTATATTTFPTTKDWRSVAISESGRYALACDYTSGKIWYSYDFAVTWTASTTTFSSPNWWNVCSSRTGQYALACDFATNHKVWYSSDFGQTWTASATTFPNTVTWRACAMSGTGQYALACDVNNGGKVWYSSNYGQTWTQSTIGASANSKFRSVAMSDTGQYGIAVDNGWGGVLGYIWYSSNYGVTWTASAGTNTVQWNTVSITYNGKFAIVCDITTGGKLWYSIDYGISWTAYTFGPTTSVWRGCAISPSGNYALAADTTLNNNLWYAKINGSISLLPGYKVISYTLNNFQNIDTTIDCTNNAYGTTTYMSNILSLRLYYQGIEIKNNNIPINIPYSITNSSSNMIDKTGLLYYYPFDTDVVNYSSASDGNTYELSSATLTTSTTKLTSGSLSIGLGGYFRVPSHSINPALGYSIALWYKLGTKTGSWSRVFDFSRITQSPDGILLGYPILESNVIYFSSSGGGAGDVVTNYTMDTNWHHVCATCSIGGYWTLYIDAVEISMQNRQITPTVANLNYCYINKSNYTQDGSSSCNINQLLVFNREIKPYEVYYLYQNPTTVQLGYMQSQISNASLQYYYPLKGNFNDISNSTFIEGGINDGIYTGITALDTIGISSSKSLRINSSGAFQVPAHYITINYSISLWFKLNSTTIGGGSRVFDFAPSLNANGSVVLWFPNANSGALYFTPNNGVATQSLIGYTMDTNWHHICVTCNINVWNIYIDGSFYYTITSSATTSLLNYCYIAKSTFGDGNITCNVNQLAVFSKTLTLTEIQTLKNNPTQPITLSNIMYYYPFNTDFFDYSKTIITNVGTDNSTHTNVTIDTKINTLPLDNGTYTGGVIATTQSIMINGSISIDSTRFFQVPSHYIPTNYSIALWVYLNSYSSGNWSRILDFAAGINGSPVGGPILFFQNTNSGSLGFSPAGGPNINYYDLKTLLINTWYHVCVTYNGTTWTVYVDGTSIHTSVYTASTYLLQYCYIGRSTFTADSTTNCNVNQLSIFNQCLTVDQITTLRTNPNKYTRLTNLMYYYPFDKDFYDYSKIRTNSPSANINSSVGWIQIPSHYINPTGYSISLWYKLNSYAVGSGARVFDFSPTLNGATGGGVIIYFPTNSITMYFNPNDGLSTPGAVYTMDLNWHHICVTLSNITWKVFVDASLCYTVDYTPTTRLLNYCYIGKSTFSINGDVNCNVNQLAIYQRTLNVDEVRFLYDNPNCPINNNTITNTALTNYYPCFPGCYLFVNNKTAVPVYASIANQNWTYGQDGAWWVLPGFKIIVYSAINYGGTSFVVDNTYGFNNMCKMSDKPNAVISIKLYYKGQEIIHGGIFNTVNYTLTNSIPSSIPYKYVCNNNLDVPLTNNSQTSFPGAWIITTGGSYPVYETINDLSTIGANESGTAYDVLPGFKLVIYTSTYLNGTATTYWNDGYSIYRIYAPTTTVINSVALYFHGQPIVKKRYLEPSNMAFCISTRLVVPTYSGVIMNIRRSSDSATKDFYSDAQQTYLTTGPNNTGQTYASWIGVNTGYVKTMYDQSGKGNHCSNTTDSAQPTLSLYNGKYVIQFVRANSTCLNITTPCQPNTAFTHFYNTDVLSTGQYISGILATSGTYELRFNFYNYTTASLDTIANINLSPKTDVNDWYYTGTGNKLSYVNNINSSVLSFSWAVLSTSVQNPTWFGNNSKFTQIGTSNYSKTLRGFNGYMTEMICHNTEMSSLDMQQYYADQLILTQNAVQITSTPTTYTLNTTYYPSQVKGIWNDLVMPVRINISFTYQFNYTGSTNSGVFYVSVDDFGWIIINGGAPTLSGFSSWSNGYGVTGAMPIINGINTIEIIGYNYNAGSMGSGGAACFGAFYDSDNTLIAYTNSDWKTKIVNTIDQTSLLADPIGGGLWVTTYSFTENEGYYSISQTPTIIKTPNHYLNIPKLKPVSSQVISNFSSSSTVNPLINANTTLWGFKAVGYFVPTSTGTWTFTMYGDDVAQIWIGVSATNPATINPLSTPNLSCFNETKTFTVSVTINVKYPILIYMGNSQGNNGINPNGFSLSVTDPTSLIYPLRNVFMYLNCPPTDRFYPASNYVYDGSQRSVYTGGNYATAPFGSGNTIDFPSQVLCIWSEPNFRGVAFAAGPYILFTYTFNYTGVANTGTYKIIVDDIAYLYFNGSAPNRCDRSITCSGSIPLINGTNYIEAIVYNTGGEVGFIASFFNSSNNLVAYTDGSWKYQLLNPISLSASPIHLPVQGGLWTTVYSSNATSGIPFTYYTLSNTNINNATYYYTNLDTINNAVISRKIISNFSIPNFATTNSIHTEVTGNIVWGFKATGFFVPDVTGSWTFTLLADDCAELWIGSDSAGNITSICPVSTSTTSNANIRVFWDPAVAITYTVTLTSGRYYPILLYYGEGVGGQYITFTYKPTASALAQTVDKYLYYVNAPPIY